MPMEIEDEDLANVTGKLIYVSPYAESGSDLLSKNVVKGLGTRSAVIMANHGITACGKDVEEAFEVALSMEEAARRIINKRLGNLVKED